MNKIVEVALKYVGVKESPAGSNMTEFGKWFGLNGQPWCGMFASFVYAEAGYPLGIIDYSKGMAGCPFALKLFTKRGEIVTKEQVQPGDLVIYDWDGNGVPDHVEIFKDWHGPEKHGFDAIGGNTAKSKSKDPKEIRKADSNGGEVALRDDRAAVMGVAKIYFIHPKVLDKAA